MFTVDENKFLKDANGAMAGSLVNSFVAAEMVFPGASVICCRLWDGTVAQETEVSPADALQFRMTTAAARRFAKLLLEAADEIDGVDHPQQ